MGTKINALFVRQPDPREVVLALESIAGDLDEMTVALVPTGAWTALYADDLDDLESVSELLSVEIGAAIVHVRMLDGDAVEMRLLIDGDERGWLATPAREWGRKSIGKIEPWRPLLPSDAVADEITRAWRRPPPTLGELVRKTAAHLGIDPNLADQNVYALPPDHPGRVGRTLGRALEREPIPTGPPRMFFSQGPLDEDLALGERAELFYSVENEGGPGEGAHITINGSALERGVVAIESVSVSERGSFRSIHRAATKPITIERPGVLHAGAQVLSLRVVVRAVAAGDATLAVTVAPRSGVAHDSTIRIEVSQPGRRPLRALANPSALRPLWQPDSVEAWVLLDVSREDAVARATEAILAFHALLRVPDDLVYRRFSVRASTRPRYAPVPASKLTERAVRTWLKDATSLTLMRDHGDTDMGVLQDLVALQLTSVFAERGSDRPVPHLGFSLSMKARRPEEVTALERELVDLVDRIASATPIHQAFVERWSPGALHFDSTPYEGACGVDGQCTSLASWVERWLRAVSPNLWIGPHLLARVDPTALETIGQLKHYPSGALRITTDRTSLDVLERALAPLLPDRRAWNAGMKRLYR